MAKWTGWVAAAGGALGLIGQYSSQSMAAWAVPTGTIAAIIFGIWAVYE